MNLTLADGHIRPGHYECLDVVGDTLLDDGVVFDVLRVQGRLSAQRLRGEVLHLDGELLATGSIDVGTLSGSGCIEAGGEIRTRRMQFVGDLHAKGRIRVLTDLDVSGSLYGASAVTAERISVYGVLDAGHLCASGDVTIRPIETLMLRWSCFRQYDRGSTADTICCRYLDAKDLSCHSVVANTVDLRGASEVADVRCLTTLSMDRDAVALRVSGGCERVTLNG